ncbi:MAG: COX15/CtaA family protein [Gemmatimonadales bacterium]
MPRRFTVLAWVAAAATYLLIILGGVVRITGSGMGCGDDWPLCHGRLFPPLHDLGTFIEWNHRLVAAVVSMLVGALAGHAWWLRREAGGGRRETSPRPHIPTTPTYASYVALSLLAVQVLLGAITVRLELPHWSVVLHLATAMLLLAALLVAAQGGMRRPGTAAGLALGLGFATVLLGAVTAKLGAATACLGFPLCNGQLVPDGNYLQHVHWTHRLLAYGTTAYVIVWALRARTLGSRIVLALTLVQIGVGATMVLRALPAALQVLHLAVGTAVWAALVLVALHTAPAPAPAQARAPALR